MLEQSAVKLRFLASQYASISPHPHRSFLLLYRAHCPSRKASQSDHHNLKMHMMLEAAVLVKLLGDVEYQNTVPGERHHIVSLKHLMKAASERYSHKAIFRAVRVDASAQHGAHLARLPRR